MAAFIRLVAALVLARRSGSGLLALVLALTACRPGKDAAPVFGPTFAVIGDYGDAGPAEAAVARLVRGWQPGCIVTTGDNNYEVGAAETIDPNIGQYYHPYIGHYRGTYGPGAGDSARFFPALGNHDLYTAHGAPYFDYFTLPGNERYYAVRRGEVAFFLLNSDPSEPDGVDSASTQARWLRGALATSGALWKVVVLHHPPYSSGAHGSSDWMQWPYRAWGADVVLAGHDHTYERLLVDGLPYLVNGLGGRARYSFQSQPVAGSLQRYNAAHGALRGRVSVSQLSLTFITTAGQAVDSLVLTR